jgi:hypothetical protein
MGLPNDYLPLLLARYVAILESDHFGNLVTGMIAIPAFPRIIDDPAPGPFPHVRVFETRTLPSQSPVGSGFIGYNISITMRLLSGAVASGSVGDHEDLANALTAPILNKFALFTQLNDPDTLDSFDMLDNADQRMVIGAGVTQFAYGPQGSPVYYVGKDITDEVKVFTKRK